jgi:hypothetical protein
LREIHTVIDGCSVSAFVPMNSLELLHEARKADALLKKLKVRELVTPSRRTGRARTLGAQPAAQNEQWWLDAKSVSTAGLGVASESTLCFGPNDGHGTAVDVGLPVAAKFAQAVRMLVARASWLVLRVPGNGVFG